MINTTRFNQLKELVLSDDGTNFGKAISNLTATDLSSSFDRNGSTLLHWAAGNPTGSSCLHILLTPPLSLDPNLRGRKKAKNRTPLHYSARNGAHDNLLILLSPPHNALPDAHAKDAVTPLQLACWQNNLEIAETLISAYNVDPTQRNAFNCGVVHWLGLSPSPTSLLPLAKFLKSSGCDFSTKNVQTQGHNALHKAAWGNSPRSHEYAYWLRDENDVCDCVVDSAGNYAADLADMANHKELAELLRMEFSDARKKSCSVLNICLADASNEMIVHQAYLNLAKAYHPDRRGGQANDGGVKFDAIKKARDHLILEGGRGHQKNEKHKAVQLIEEGKSIVEGKPDKSKSLFKTKLLTVISDFNDKGFPISGIVRRWNQIWPDDKFPVSSNFIAVRKTKQGVEYEKKVKLLEFLKFKAGDVVYFEDVGGIVLATARCN